MLKNTKDIVITVSCIIITILASVTVYYFLVLQPSKVNESKYYDNLLNQPSNENKYQACIKGYLPLPTDSPDVAKTKLQRVNECKLSYPNAGRE